MPGCFSAADTYDEILDNAREAALLHLGDLEDIPDATEELESLAKFIDEETETNKQLVLVVDVDLSTIAGPAKRVNVTIPEFALAKIDAAASSAGKSRSEFLTEAGLRDSLSNKNYSAFEADVVFNCKSIMENELLLDIEQTALAGELNTTERALVYSINSVLRDRLGYLQFSSDHGWSFTEKGLSERETFIEKCNFKLSKFVPNNIVPSSLASHL